MSYEGQGFALPVSRAICVGTKEFVLAVALRSLTAAVWNDASIFTRLFPVAHRYVKLQSSRFHQTQCTFCGCLWRPSVCGDLTSAFDFRNPNNNPITVPSTAGLRENDSGFPRLLCDFTDVRLGLHGGSRNAIDGYLGVGERGTDGATHDLTVTGPCAASWVAAPERVRRWPRAKRSRRVTSTWISRTRVASRVPSR